MVTFDSGFAQENPAWFRLQFHSRKPDSTGSGQVLLSRPLHALHVENGLTLTGSPCGEMNRGTGDGLMRGSISGSNPGSA